MAEFDVDGLRDSCWECENCGCSIDLEWLVRQLIKECEINRSFKDDFLSENSVFDFGECECCNYSYWVYDEDLKKIQNFVKGI